MTAAELAAILAPVQFPQMTVNESIIVRAWLMRHGRNFDRIAFNPVMGNTIELGEGFDETTRRQAALLSQKRADVVCWHGNEVTIAECKPRLSFSALGQLLGYQLLFHLENPEVKFIHLAAIGHDASIDTPEVLLAYGVAVELFPNVSLVGSRYGQAS